MTKELDYLDKILDYEPMTLTTRMIIESIKEKIQRLESIDNANPSEALKELENCCLSHDFPEEYITITQSLIKAQEQEKVLSIIKEKPYESAPTINYIKINKDNPKMLNYEYYCMTVKDKVNESEFELLKRWLG